MEPDKLTHIRAVVQAATDPTTCTDVLTAMYLDLSGRCFRLAEEIGKAHRAYVVAEKERKAGHVSAKLRYLHDALPIGKAEACAEHDTAGLRTAEVEAHARYVELREVHRSLQDVMSAIQMRISWAKAEYQQSGRQT